MAKLYIIIESKDDFLEFDYTNFKAKLLMTNYATFIFHYFSNDIQYGIANKLYVYHFDDDDIVVK